MVTLTDTKPIHGLIIVRPMRDEPALPKLRLIVVDDDTSLRDALADYLGRNGYSVRPADGGRALDRLLSEEPADLVILDLMMPGEDGLSICRRLSTSGQPVLMLSALGETMDRVVGLELGAADYLAKPFEPRELLARIRAVLRRSGKAYSDVESTEVTFAGWRLDTSERMLFNPAGRSVPLTAGEFRLLLTFVERPRRILSRDQLLDLWRGMSAEPFDRAVDLAVSRLRRKLRHDSRLIETVRGEGYRFLPPVHRQ